MFELASNQKIGKYLKETIRKKGFHSDRSFGKKCLEFKKEPAHESAVGNMANRLSQIFKGTRGVQLDDLPAFAALLDVSCEEILSAGKCRTVSVNHLTNYSIASTSNIRDWEAYVAREDKVILNADEYGKTVLDYALEFENYDFLKFLMDKGYIWFISEPDASGYRYRMNFGAGTSIKQNPTDHTNICRLEYDLHCRHDLRSRLLTLAIQRNDLPMLEHLHARETPALLQIVGNSYVPQDADEHFDAGLIEALSNASDAVLAYFSEEFELCDERGTPNRYMFPFFNQLVDALIEKKRSCVTTFLKNAAAHNSYILDSIIPLMDSAIEESNEYYKFAAPDGKKAFAQHTAMQWLKFYPSGDFVQYAPHFKKTGIISNLIHINSHSNDETLSHLIDEVNELYNRIKNIKPKI